MPQINYFNDNSGTPEEGFSFEAGQTPGPSELMGDKLAAAIKIAEAGKKISDAVNHPSHYTQGGIECIDAIKASMTSEEFCGYLKGCTLKYLWRYKHKGKPVEDLKKAQWCQDRLIKEEESK